MNLEDLSLINTFFVVIWIMGPAYLANAIAVLTGGKFPIDQKKTLADGNRILGDGKTWSGLAGGTIGGIGVGFMLNSESGNSFLRKITGANFEEGLWGETPIIVFFLLAFGALLGDMCASFYKRRQNLQRGEQFPILDMFDFIFMSLFLCLLFQMSWLKTWILDGWMPIVTIVLITPILHRGVNIIGHKIGVKNEPW